jgi:hypothetical protein
MPKRSQKSRRRKRMESKNSDDEDGDENNKVVVEPWKEAGYESFKAYNDAMLGKITEVSSKITTLEQTSAQQLQTINELKGKKPDESVVKKPDETKPPAEEPKGDEVYKVKAAKLYATLTPEQRKEAEEHIMKLPKEVRDIAAGSYEGKYALLKSMIPDHDKATGDSFFGDLAEQPQKKSVSEQLMDALANLNGKTTVSPERKGSGFVPKKEGDVASEAAKKARPKLSSLFE